MKHIICAVHRAAHVFAQQQGLHGSEYKTHTAARGLRSLAATAEIIVVDTPYRMQDSREIHALLAERFLNVRYTTLPITA